MNGLLIHVPIAASRRLPRMIPARLIPKRVCNPKKGKHPLNIPTASPFALWLAEPSCFQIHTSDLYDLDFSFCRDLSFGKLRDPIVEG